MGLRINTNLSALVALRGLRVNTRLQSQSLERLSTGLRINRASDDPSGLVLSEQLRAQIASLKQAVENSQIAGNLINTADGALQEVSDLLIQIQDSIAFGLNTSGATAEQIAAEQSAVDQAIAAIDRIATTTRFGSRRLLDGSSGYQLVGSEPLTVAPAAPTGIPVFRSIQFRSVEFTPGTQSRTIPITLSQIPLRATIRINDPTSTAGTILRITGPRGTADISLGANTPAGVPSTTAISNAINTVAETTGAFAEILVDDIILRSEDFGVDQLVRIETVAGSLGATSFQVVDDIGVFGTFVPPSPNPGTALTPGEAVADRGRDAQVTVSGVLFTGGGRFFSINSAGLSLDLELNSDIFVPPAAAAPALGTIFSLFVGNTGLTFQLGSEAAPSDRLNAGIEGVSSSLLGSRTTRDVIAEAATLGVTQFLRGGFLGTVRSGAGNDLSQNATNAQVIAVSSLSQVTDLRGFLGALSAFNIQPNIDALEVQIENLTAALSDIRDLDFAEETANFARIQVLFQSGIAALASANLVPQSVLTLLA